MHSHVRPLPLPSLLPSCQPPACILAEGVTSEAVLVGCVSPKETIQEDTVWKDIEKSPLGGWVPRFTLKQGIPGNTSLPLVSVSIEMETPTPCHLQQPEKSPYPFRDFNSGKAGSLVFYFILSKTIFYFTYSNKTYILID